MTEADPARLAVREPPRPKPKRVYKTVSVAGEGAAWRVLLDGKPVMTPLRKPLAANKPLIEAIAAEWDAQNPHIEPETMPLTRLMSTAIDRIAVARGEIIDELMKYVSADLLCYRAAHPADLRARQDKIWQPVLDWLAGKYAIKLNVVSGIIPHEQSPEAAAAMRRAMEAMPDLRLTAFQASAAVTSSLALSLAFVEGRLAASEVFAAAHLDETYQVEKWGEDEEAAERRSHIARDIEGIGRFIALTL